MSAPGWFRRWWGRTPPALRVYFLVGAMLIGASIGLIAAAHAGVISTVGLVSVGFVSFLYMWGLIPISWIARRQQLDEIVRRVQEEDERDHGPGKLSDRLYGD